MGEKRDRREREHENLRTTSPKLYLEKRIVDWGERGGKNCLEGRTECYCTLKGTRKDVIVYPKAWTLKEYRTTERGINRTITIESHLKSTERKAPIDQLGGALKAKGGEKSLTQKRRRIGGLAVEGLREMKKNSWVERKKVQGQEEQRTKSEDKNEI